LDAINVEEMLKSEMQSLSGNGCLC